MSTRLRFVASFTVLLTALSLLGLTAPASADEVEDLIAKLERSADISSALAVEAGGYSLVSDERWSDGTSRRETSKFTVDNSHSFLRETRLPNGKVDKSGFINDRQAKTYSWMPGSDADTRQALRLLQAGPDSWILKPAPRALNVHTIRSMPAGWLLSYYLPSSNSWSYQVVTDDPLGVIVYSLRDNTPETKGSNFEVAVTLRSDGAVSAMQVTDLASDATKSFTWDYAAPVIEQPTGGAVIKKADFERAMQAPKLLDNVQYFAFHAGVNMKFPSPENLFEEARHDVKEWRGERLFIPVKVSRIKWGARLEAVNPFTKERHACDLVVDFPGSTGKPEIWCKSGTDYWKPLTMCVVTPTVSGCIESGRAGSRASRNTPQSDA